MKTNEQTSIEATSSLKHHITITKGKERTVIKIRLNDECKNGHEDFAITADIYAMNGAGGWRDAGGGCCHEHILKLRPDLAPFVALHLSTWEGTPMHAVGNAWYWFQGAFPESADHSARLGACHGGTGSSGKTPEECRQIFAEYVRATPEQVEAIASASPRSQTELQHALESMGFPEQWKQEAQSAIAQLEQWTGKKFESKATRGFWEPLSAETVALINERKASGYYLPENIAKRDAEERERVKVKAIATVEADFRKSVAKLEKQRLVNLYWINHDMGKVNAIYYDHTNEISFNWSSSDRLWTQEEFEKFKGEAVMGELPENVTFTWQARPKY